MVLAQGELENHEEVLEDGLETTYVGSPTQLSNYLTLKGSFSAGWLAGSRLYRSQILQVNMRWKALAEIYTMHSFAPFSNLNFFVKNC